MEVPETRFAQSGDLSIAYRVMGEGGVDIVHVPGLLNTLELIKSDAALSDLYQRLTRFARLILLDKRGTGLSDRLPSDAPPTLEERIDDIRAVMDAVGLDKAVLLGVADGGPVAMYFAAAHPERITALVLRATTPRLRQAPDWPWGLPPDAAAQMIGDVEREWGTGVVARYWGLEDEAEIRRIAHMEALVGTPRPVAALFRTILDTDVRDIVETIATPTLVVCYPEHPFWPREGQHYLVENIEGARAFEFSGPIGTLGDTPTESAALAELYEEHLTGVRPTPEPDRVLKTVLFTDIVGSTEKAAEVGDRRWHELLDAHDAAIRRELGRFRGQEVKATGDGFLAAFDGPARAIRCAQAISEGAQGLGLEIRAGLHTGECELRGDDLAGIAVHTGARVAALAGPSEVLVTSTVRDLVAGSGIEFTDRGRQDLKGVPGEWHVLAVRP
ncbi:MAG: alpha/beta fold hydrolase [Actinobacteria bacterium]|nr:alpha/beta fold hydrolase [Actinomycetota bacterium]